MNRVRIAESIGHKHNKKYLESLLVVFVLKFACKLEHGTVIYVFLSSGLLDILCHSSMSSSSGCKRVLLPVVCILRTHGKFRLLYAYHALRALLRPLGG